MPQDFTYNGASIPRALWPIMGHPWSGRYDQGAALHDYLYRHLGWVVLPGNGVGLLKPHYPICSVVPLGNRAVSRLVGDKFKTLETYHGQEVPCDVTPEMVSSA